MWSQPIGVQHIRGSLIKRGKKGVLEIRFEGHQKTALPKERGYVGCGRKPPWCWNMEESCGQTAGKKKKWE